MQLNAKYAGEVRVAPNQIIAIFVTWKRRKGKPVDLVAATSGGWAQALLLELEMAKKLKVPSSWMSFEIYHRRKPNTKGEARSGKAREVPAPVSTPRMHAPREESQGTVLQQRMLHEGLSGEKSAQVTGSVSALRKISKKARASS